MNEFLSQWYGILIFVLFDVAAFIAIASITYRWLFKRLFDILAAAVCILLCSPILLVVYVRGKRMQGICSQPEKLLEKSLFIGKNGKKINLTKFATRDKDGDVIGEYGAWLERTKLNLLPRLFDVFLGKLSFIGTKAFTIADAEMLSETDEEKLLVRPALIHPSIAKGEVEPTYLSLIQTEVEYAKNYSFFGDIKIFFQYLLRVIRGENNVFFGETAEKTYAKVLLEKGEITQEDYDGVQEYAREEEQKTA